MFPGDDDWLNGMVVVAVVCLSQAEPPCPNEHGMHAQQTTPALPQAACHHHCLPWWAWAEWDGEQEVLFFRWQPCPAVVIVWPVSVTQAACGLVSGDGSVMGI